jgi:predicted RecA/RadA family phage recombinase
MQNFIQPGDVVRVVAPYACTSGVGVKVNQLFGVATANAVNQANVEVMTVGVFDLAKVNAASTSIAQGANVYWDDTNLKATFNSSAAFRIGVATAPSTNTDLTIRTRLHGAW